MFKKFIIIIMILLLPLVSCEVPKVIEESKIISVITEEAEVLPTAAILNGNLLEADQNIIDCGFEWWNAVNSTKQQVSLGEISEERFFRYQLDELNEQIEYFYQAYVKIEEAVIYGEIKMFVPLPEEVPPTINVETIILNENELVLNLEETFQLEVIVLPEDAEDKSFLWISSDQNIVEVNEDGLIIGRNIGTACIKAIANCNEKEDLCKVLVKYPSVGDFEIGDIPEIAEIYTSLNVILPEDVEIFSITSNSEDVCILENTLNFMAYGEAEIKIEYSFKDEEIKTVTKTIIIKNEENEKDKKDKKDKKDSNKSKDKEKKVSDDAKKTKWYGHPDIPEALWHINTTTWRMKTFDGVKHWIDDKDRHYNKKGKYLYTDSYVDPPPPPEWDD